jgi:hypothetical protein
MGTKKWNREADGIYRHVPSNKLYWRPWVDGKRTWESLGTENLKLAKETYHKRVAGLPAGVTKKNHLDRVGSGRADDGPGHPKIRGRRLPR